MILLSRDSLNKHVEFTWCINFPLQLCLSGSEDRTDRQMLYKMQLDELEAE